MNLFDGLWTVNLVWRMTGLENSWDTGKLPLIAFFGLGPPLPRIFCPFVRAEHAINSSSWSRVIASSQLSGWLGSVLPLLTHCLPPACIIWNAIVTCFSYVLKLYHVWYALFTNLMSYYCCGELMCHVIACRRCSSSRRPGSSFLAFRWQCWDALMTTSSSSWFLTLNWTSRFCTESV